MHSASKSWSECRAESKLPLRSRCTQVRHALTGSMLSHGGTIKGSQIENCRFEDQGAAFFKILASVQEERADLDDAAAQLSVRSKNAHEFVFGLTLGAVVTHTS